MHGTKGNWWIRGLKFALLAVVAVGAAGAVVMGLWNWLAPELFGWRAIGFWQALGLLVLSRILLGGFRGGAHRMHWRARMMERWAQMSDEEREQFRAGLRRHHCGRRGGDEPTPQPKP